jgi:hypothetical protein
MKNVIVVMCRKLLKHRLEIILLLALITAHFSYHYCLVFTGNIILLYLGSIILDCYLFMCLSSTNHVLET